MTSKLPATPAEALQISVPPLRLVVRAVTGLADRLGFWRAPLAGAAAASDEMTTLDTLYWVQKSRAPVTQPGADVPDMRADPVALPEGFVPDTRVTLAAAGDILRSRGIDGSKDVVFARIADLLFDADLSIANFESPITTQPLVEEVIGDKGPPLECCDRVQFDILKGHGGRRFDVMNTANNHRFDMGLEGIETTSRVLAEEAILEIGTNSSPDQQGRGWVIERDGLRIGLVSDTFGLNGHKPPAGEGWRINVSALSPKRGDPDLSSLKRQIDDCRAQGCDFILATVHWGWEFEMFPRAGQVAAARELAEYGADSIVSHHPHVIQPVETYRTARDPDRVAVIAYSLGSLTWGFTAPHIVLSTVLNMTLAKGRVGAETRTYLERLSVTPVFRTHVEEDGVALTRIEKLADHADAADSPLDRDHVAQVAAHADRVLGSSWRTQGG